MYFCILLAWTRSVYIYIYIYKKSKIYMKRLFNCASVGEKNFDNYQDARRVCENLISVYLITHTYTYNLKSLKFILKDYSIVHHLVKKKIRY